MADEEESPVQTLARELVELKEKVEWVQRATGESTTVLEKDLAGTDRAVVTLNDRISMLERGAEEDRATISRLVEKLSSMMSGELASATRTAQITRDGARLLAERIAELEQTSMRYGGLIRALNDRVAALEGHPHRAPDDEFSLPIGRGVPVFPKTSAHLVTRDQVQRGAYNDGYLAGQNSMVEAKSDIERRATQSAADRVMSYMVGHFSEATIAGVVRAVRGIPQTGIPSPVE